MLTNFYQLLKLAGEHMSGLRICTGPPGCTAPTHYENCPRCFGFGVMFYTTSSGRTSDYPISAEEAVKGSWPSPWHRCPVCNSTPDGVPHE